ncbi:COX15/CtaA family [Syncephalis pseudoplumigaleata]|uniref:COX15/CtaA family n=1 Tax=Syncephalis pseudoplumigaleata TaxID=1712513 RepID=A0A4P9YUQ7_9FUNG|nr:COX15/CtaA family [Syncephalis pseudoplumigaleata]|eukprot:RKP23525.1 COX15/CtaA family [Syncephalis pseudoplumigaleata]
MRRRLLTTTSTAHAAPPPSPGTIAATIEAEAVKQAPSSTHTATPSAATPPIVGYWLIGSGVLVFGIVVLGGLTRPTESGLSIVEWNVLKGVWPPLTQQGWEEEFDKYKQYPEYKILNHGMSLDEFKRIFYMEWGHRLWGRVIGLSFVLPAIYFWRRGLLPRSLGKRVLGISALIGFQGVLGWYMVKSGLDEEMITPHGVPRVSQYRLAAHLGSAFLIYIGMLTTGWDVLRQARPSLSHIMSSNALKRPALQRLRLASLALSGLVFLTAMSGAFVAGLDAGLLYDTFPKMGGRWIPPEHDIWSEVFTQPGDVSRWRNLFENPTTVQFDHRVLGTTTVAATMALWYYACRLPLPPAARRTAHGMLAAALVQISLGISTLLYAVPIPLAASHQAGSLVLLTVVLRLAHLLKRSPVKL